MTKVTSSLAPEKAFCPNCDCPARGRVAEGNIGVHSHKERRYICQVCDKTFSATTGTVFYRRQKEAELIERVVTLLALGCPIQAIVVAFKLDERTVRAWLDASGAHCQAVHEQLVEQPRPLGQVQCDELRVKAQGVVLWVALAIQVQTRLWLGVAVSSQRRLDRAAHPPRQTCGERARWGVAVLHGWLGKLSHTDQSCLPRKRTTHGAGPLPLAGMA
jgi:transposase-like protein